ncbi:MAG: hypothetical protein ACK2UO_03105 [Caldilineaceae bacterium]
MRPYLIHQDKMWFVISGCRIVAITDNKTDGMQIIRELPPNYTEQSISSNGGDPSRKK